MDSANTCGVKIYSFNCKSVTRSVDSVKSLCRTADFVCLQETWLMPHDIPFLGTIDSDFAFTGKSAVDTSKGLLRGRPYGGVAILWRKSVFRNVTVVDCNSDRISAIKVQTMSRYFLMFSVYMPTDDMGSIDNLAEFLQCLGEIRAVIDESGIECVFILGDFNANYNKRFGKELVNFCIEQNVRCFDWEYLGVDSDTYTYQSDIDGSRSWLDHCLVSEAARSSTDNICVRYGVYWSDHFPLELCCNLCVLSPKTTLQMSEKNKIMWKNRDASQIKLFSKYCFDHLRNIDFPSDFSNCSDYLCNNKDHRCILDQMYASIVDILQKAASLSNNYNNVKKKCNKKPYMVGWN